MPRDNTPLLKKLMNGQSIVVIRRWIKQHFVQKVSGKGLSTNDFTDECKDKVESMESVASDRDVERMISDIFDR